MSSLPVTKASLPQQVCRSLCLVVCGQWSPDGHQGLTTLIEMFGCPTEVRWKGRNFTGDKGLYRQGRTAGSVPLADRCNSPVLTLQVMQATKYEDQQCVTISQVAPHPPIPQRSRSIYSNKLRFGLQKQRRHTNPSAKTNKRGFSLSTFERHGLDFAPVKLILGGGEIRYLPAGSVSCADARGIMVV
ncbi:hypothetical protein PoB_002692800 [Plakobranchus ocellatus]|uniref:Uncharacterized protein n=1 Tax=Plakobranchus ocellatus TaxID=259542 RepID=A0AAV4A115_9GAST|nr:hypothetical protein PoB_002692800 [Plakobranchus ocellatus]